MTKRWVMAGCAALLVAGCAGGRGVEVAQRAQQALVGMPQEVLLSCAGVPARRTAAGDAEFFTYVAQAGGYGGGPSTSIGVGGGSASGVGVGIGFGIPLFSGGGGACRATFTLRGGVVRQLVYAADSSLAACAPIVDNCLPPAPPPR